jgi:TIR domain
MTEHFMTLIFLSHKACHRDEADDLVKALRIVLNDGDWFKSEEISKSKDFRNEINRALKESKCFLLLYTDPTLDWSWCFYEAGTFGCASGEQSRPIFCLHPDGVQPPSPLANLQTIRGQPEDIESWIQNDLCTLLGRRQPAKADLDQSVQAIKVILEKIAPISDRVLKPNILITPRWPGESADWNAMGDLPDIDFSTALVSVDMESATQLGFAAPPKKQQLLPFLQQLDCDTERYSQSRPMWVDKFYDSLREAVRNRLQFQEVAYFRHTSGNIIRPIVVSVGKNAAGTTCRLRVIFAPAFGAPLTENPSQFQRLADGVRLAARTRLEVVEPYLGRMTLIHQEKVLSNLPEHAIDRRTPVGGRVIAGLEAIWQEAMAHGLNPNHPPLVLFSKPDQQTEYESIRHDGIEVWEALKTAAADEDGKRTGNYTETERLLGKLKVINERYLRLVLPRLGELAGSTIEK